MFTVLIATGYVIGMNKPWLTWPETPAPKKAPSLIWSCVIFSIVRLMESPVDIFEIFPFSSNLISAL